MKKTVQQVALIAAFILTQQLVFAQSADDTPPPSAPRWVSDKGYWIVENNVKAPKKYVVFFYTNDGQLVHKQNIEGVTLKVHKRKVKMQLKRTLETAVLAWEKGREPENSRESIAGSQESKSSL